MFGGLENEAIEANPFLSLRIQGNRFGGLGNEGMSSLSFQLKNSRLY